MDLISIIIPLYNKENYIEKTLQSAINQSYKNIEIIIINDGTTDNSIFICERVASNFRNIRILNQGNRGVSVSRNRGIMEARGSYISFLDADDLLDKDFISKLYSAIGEANAIYCNHYYIKRGKLKKKIMHYRNGDILSHYLYNRCTPNTNSWLIKKSFLLENQIFFPEDRKWGEDMTFFIKLLCHETNIRYVKERLTIYNQDVEMSLSENSINKINQDIYWLEDVIHYIKHYVLDRRRKTTAIQAIKSYRIPGAIIYRLLQNKKFSNKQDYKKVKNKYSSLINTIGFTNGLRSLKLYVYKFLI